MRVLGLVLTLLAGAGGCAATCARIAGDREALMSPARRPPVGWHLALALPFERINSELRRRWRDVPAIALRPEGLGPVERFFRRLELQLRGAVVKGGPDDAVRFELEGELRYAEESVATLIADVEVRPQLDLERGVLEAALRPDSITTVTPRLSPGAARRLSELIRKQLPAGVSALLPAELSDRAASAVIALLGARVFELIRGVALSRMKELTRLRVALPGVPIERFGIRSLPGALLLLARARLPAAEAIELPGGVAPGPSLRAWISASAAVELARWALVHRRLPGRIDGDGKPSERGELAFLPEWRGDDPRPLKLHLFRAGLGTCLHLCFGAIPRLRTVDGKLELGVEQTVLEQVDGPPLLRAAIWLRGTWSRVIAKVQRIGAQTELAIAGEKLRVRLERAGLERGRIELELRAL